MSKFNQSYTTFSEKPRVIEAKIDDIIITIDDLPSDFGFNPMKSYTTSVAAQNLLKRIRAGKATKAMLYTTELKCYNKGDIYPPLISQIYHKEGEWVEVDIASAINFIKRFENPEGATPKALMELKMRFNEYEDSKGYIHYKHEIKCVGFTIC